MASVSGLLLTMGGCIMVNADGDGDWDMEYSNSSERVYSADITDGEIAVRVAASGCTTKEFFDVDVDREDGNRFTIELDRERRDYCEMHQPNGETLTWTFSELGIPEGAKVTLLNPVGR
ncbi:MAG: hypothetical protein CMK09_06885 [Ponticaulis sp.]|nr:hypothetical protein [Ponticaulis sp.]